MYHRPLRECHLDPGNPPEPAEPKGNPLHKGYMTPEQRTAIRESQERDFWSRKAEGLLIEAFSENLHGLPAERQAMIDAARLGDMAELGRLVWSHVEPYLEYEMERES